MANNLIQALTPEDQSGTSGHSHGQAEQRDRPAADQHPDLDSDSSDNEFPGIDSDEFRELHHRWRECKCLLPSTDTSTHTRALCSLRRSTSAPEGQASGMPTAQVDAVITHQNNN